MHRADLSDTIAAISTPVGEGGIGIVRLSGKDSLKIADKIFFSSSGKRPSSFRTFTLHYGLIKDGKNVLDEVILSVMRSPKSYTKEDIVEINCHGGIVALRDILALVLKAGARLADPGEFTKRAFLNGRIDLTQAEAVIDIIRAKTDSALKVGVDQLKGAVSMQVNKIREVLLSVLSGLEANIDFPEENLGPGGFKTVFKELEQVNLRLKAIIESSKFGQILREGVHVVICGKPNTGKSSLLNTLLKKERSIVTAIAGTTRDTVEEIIDIKGVPVRIVDTAGILRPRNIIEKKAVMRSKKHIDIAQIILMIFDGSKRLSQEDKAIISKLNKKEVIAVVNKIDLKQKIERAQILKVFDKVVDISAKKGKNIDILEKAIIDLIYSGRVLGQEAGVVVNLRQMKLIEKAQNLIAKALKSLDNKLPVDLLAQDIKDALNYLDDVLGKRFSEDLLDKIFNEFCIGK